MYDTNILGHPRFLGEAFRRCVSRKDATRRRGKQTLSPTKIHRKREEKKQKKTLPRLSTTLGLKPRTAGLSPHPPPNVQRSRTPERGVTMVSVGTILTVGTIFAVISIVTLTPAVFEPTPGARLGCGGDVPAGGPLGHLELQAWRRARLRPHAYSHGDRELERGEDGPSGQGSRAGPWVCQGDVRAVLFGAVLVG